MSAARPWLLRSSSPDWSGRAGVGLSGRAVSSGQQNGGGLNHGTDVAGESGSGCLTVAAAETRTME